MLSHDHSVPKARYGLAVQEERIKYNPDGYNFITRNVLPRLMDMGVSEETINQIMVENPRRFFDFRPSANQDGPALAGPGRHSGRDLKFLIQIRKPPARHASRSRQINAAAQPFENQPAAFL